MEVLVLYAGFPHTRHLSLDVFKELEAAVHTSPTCKQYANSKDARAALKAALLKLGRIRP